MGRLCDFLFSPSHSSSLAGRVGGWVIADGPGLRALPLIGAALTLAGVGVAVYLRNRDRTELVTARPGSPTVPRTATDRNPSCRNECR